MPHTRSIRLARALCASSLLLAHSALAADDPPPPAPMSADLSAPYITLDALVEKTRATGFSHDAWETLEDPETPNATRAALIDAATRSGKNPKLARVYLRRLKAGRRGRDLLTLDDLKTHELFSLGYMLARQDPKSLAPIGGKSEVARAHPLLMLTSASNRHRGDLAIKLVLAQIKAQQAINSPDDALCKPARCIDQALEHFIVEWSVHPDAVCNIVDAVDAHTPEKTPFKARATCARVRSGDDDAPQYAAHAEREQTSPSRFSKPSPPPSSASNSRSNAAQLQMLTQQLALVDQTIRQLEAEKRRMSPLERVLMDQMIRELHTQRQILQHHLAAHQRAVAASRPKPVASQSTTIIAPAPNTNTSNLPVQSGSSPTPADGAITFNNGNSGGSQEVLISPNDEEEEDSDAEETEENPSKDVIEL